MILLCIRMARYINNSNNKGPVHNSWLKCIGLFHEMRLNYNYNSGALAFMFVALAGEVFASELVPYSMSQVC